MIVPFLLQSSLHKLFQVSLPYENYVCVPLKVFKHRFELGVQQIFCPDVTKGRRVSLVDVPSWHVHSQYNTELTARKSLGMVTPGSFIHIPEESSSIHSMSGSPGTVQNIDSSRVKTELVSSFLYTMAGFFLFVWLVLVLVCWWWCYYSRKFQVNGSVGSEQVIVQY